MCSALQNLKLMVNANYVDEHYKDFQGCYIYTNIQNQVICGTINGQPLARTPNLRISVTPSDMQTLGWGTLTEFVTYEHVGQHYQDGTGLNPLGSYYDLAAGIVATMGDNWQLRVMGSNLTNQFGLTEGNARFGGNAVQNRLGSDVPSSAAKSTFSSSTSSRAGLILKSRQIVARRFAGILRRWQSFR